MKPSHELARELARFREILAAGGSIGVHPETLRLLSGALTYELRHCATRILATPAIKRGELIAIARPRCLCALERSLGHLVAGCDACKPGPHVDREPEYSAEPLGPAWHLAVLDRVETNVHGLRERRAPRGGCETIAELQERVRSW